MPKLVRVLATACVAVCMMFLAVACSSGQASSESSSEPPSGSSSASSSASSSQAKAAPSVLDKPMYVLVVGNDSRYRTLSTGDLESDWPSYSDVMILMRVDPVHDRISLLSLPRDTRVELDGEVAKLNGTYEAGGMDLLVEHVEAITGVEIAYTADLGFATFSEFVDAMGGVTVDIPFDMSCGDPILGGTQYLPGGESQHLDGAAALAFGRQRKQYGTEQDACRQTQDRQILQSLIQFVMDQPADQAPAYCDILLTYAKTDIPRDDLVLLVRHFMENSSKVTFQSGTGPFSGGIDPETELWLIDPDPDTYAMLRIAMEAGVDLTEIVPLPEVYPGE